MAIKYKPKAILALLIVAVIFPIVSYFFYFQLESIIHGSLYDYGLVFDNAWADPFSLLGSSYLVSQAAVWFLFGGSIISFIVYDVNKTNRWRSACVLLLASGTILSFLNIFIFYNLDLIVNFDLYQYGLTYNVEWYSNYSSTLSILYLSSGSMGIVSLVAAILLQGSATKKKRLPKRLFDSILIAIGTAILSLSIIYSESIIALIGLGLLFWGVTFTYVTTSEYVKKDLLDVTMKASQEMLNRIVQKLEYRGETVYLPPQFFNTSDTYKAYITKNKMETVPTAEMLPKQKPDLIIDRINNPQAVLITPPGVELAKLFEKILEKDFITTSLHDLQRYLPELLIEELEVTPYFDMQIENDFIRVALDDSYFRVPNAEIELSSLYFFFNSPLVCAIACVLAKATGIPLIIEKLKTSMNS